MVKSQNLPQSSSTVSLLCLFYLLTPLIVSALGLTPGLQLESHKTAMQEARRSGSFNLLFMPPWARSSALLAGVFHRVHLVVENVINEV